MYLKKHTPHTFGFGINHVGGYKSKTKSIKTLMKSCTAPTQKSIYFNAENLPEPSTYQDF